MPQRTPFAVRELDRDDIAMFRELLSVMGRAFDDPDTYTGAQPDAAYLRKLLAGAYFIALAAVEDGRSEEHTSELQSLMRISYAVFCLKKQKHASITSSNGRKKNILYLR